MHHLTKIIDDTVVYDADDGEWTLGELNPDASYTIVKTITKFLTNAKKDIPKKLTFGDSTPLKNAEFNALIDELIMDIEWGTDDTPRV